MQKKSEARCKIKACRRRVSMSGVFLCVHHWLKLPREYQSELKKSLALRSSQGWPAQGTENEKRMIGKIGEAIDNYKTLCDSAVDLLESGWVKEGRHGRRENKSRA